MTDSQRLTVFDDFYIQPGRIEQWKVAHRPVRAACAAEPECPYFDVFHNPNDPGYFRLVEMWNASQEWFENHQLTKSYYKTLWEGSKQTWRKYFAIEYLQRLGEGMSCKPELFSSQA